MRVAVRGFHFDDALADFEDRDVERAAAEVEDRDGLFLLAVKPVGECRSRRLVDDAHHFKPRDLARVFRRLALRVVEISGHGDDRLINFLAQVILGRLLHLLQDHGRDFRRRPLFAARLDTHIAAIRGRFNFVRDLQS